MREEQLDDLKQFIAVTVTQTEKRLEKRIQDEIAQLRCEMADGFRVSAKLVSIFMTSQPNIAKKSIEG